MIEATLGSVPPEEWVPINRSVVPGQEVPCAPPEGPGLVVVLIFVLLSL